MSGGHAYLAQQHLFSVYVHVGANEEFSGDSSSLFRMDRLCPNPKAASVAVVALSTLLNKFFFEVKRL